MDIQGIILCGLYATLFWWLLTKSAFLKSLGFSSHFLGLAFSLKVAGHFIQQAIYTYYYTDRSTADIYRFFDDGIILKKAFWNNPSDYFKMISGIRADTAYFYSNYYEKMNAWIKPFDSGFYNDNHTMIRLNAAFNWLSFDHYEVNGLFFTILSFIGSLLIVSALLKRASDRNAVLILCSLIPSSMLWLVGGLKECLLLFGIGATIFSCYQIFIKDKRGLFEFSLLILGAITMGSVKIYFLFALVPSIITAGIIYKTSCSRLWQAFSIWIIISLSGYYGLTLLDFDIIEFIARKQGEFINHMSEASAGSSIKIEKMSPTLLGLIEYIPLALTNATLRPLIPKSIPETLLWIENIILWTVLFLALRKALKPDVNDIYKLVLVATFSFSLMILIGTTTPVLGAIMRYRAPIILIVIVFAFNYISIPNILKKSSQ